MLARPVLKSDIMGDMPNKSVVNITRLEKLMRKKGWGLGELAEYSKVKYDTIYSLAKGRRPNTSVETLKKIADALDTSTDYLLGTSDDDTPPIQKLPEPVRQLAEIASQLSEIRREELLRIAAALHEFEQEQINIPLPGGTMRALLKLAEQIDQNGSNDDLLQSLRALMRKPPRGWFIDGDVHGQGPENPSQRH